MVIAIGAGSALSSMLITCELPTVDETYAGGGEFGIIAIGCGVVCELLLVLAVRMFSVLRR